MIPKTSFLVLVFIGALAPTADAAPQTVTNTADTLAAGTLRSALTAAGGGDTISWSGAGGGTITLGSALPTAAGGVILDASSALSPVTINLFSIPLAAAATFNNSSGNAWTISSAITGGAGALTKGLAGTVVLTGTNSYGGGTTINAGTLNINGDGALGTGGTGIIMNGGTLQAAAGITSARAINLASSAAFDTQSFNSTLSGPITGAGGLNFLGAGTLTLSSIASTYGGGTTINTGTLSVSDDRNLGAGTGAVTFNAAGGTLQTTTGIASARSFVLNAPARFDTQNLNSTLSGVISGGSSLTFIGTGKVTMTGANTYLGGTTLNGGTLNVNNGSALGLGSLVIVGGTLQAAANNISITSMSINTPTDALDTLGNSLKLSGSISGGGTLNIKNDVGGTVLSFTSPFNSYFGGTVFNAGTINVNNSNLGSGPITFNGGVLQTGTTVTFNNTITLNAAGGTIDTLGNQSFFTAAISGAGILTDISTGILTLQGINTYTGGTLLSSGTLNAGNLSPLGTGVVTFNGGVLQAGVSGLVLTNSMTLTKTAVFDTNGANVSLSGPGALSGPGGLTKIGPGTLALFQAAGANTYGGTTSVLGGTLGIGVSGALPAGTPLFLGSGGTFDTGKNSQTVASVDASGGGTLRAVLQPGVTNLTVSGNAKLTNGSLSVSLPVGAVVKAGATFTPITYGTNAGVTNFVSVLSPGSLAFTPTYTGGGGAGGVVLTTVLVPFANSAINSNQAAIGGGLEAMRVNPAGDQITVLSNLYSLSGPLLAAALDQVGPVGLASMQAVGMAGASVQAAAVGQRMAALADGADHEGFEHYAVARRSFYPGTLVAAAGLGDAPVDPDAEHEIARPGSPWGFFTSLEGTSGRLNEANNSAAGTQPGYAFESGGITGGADYRLDERRAVGVALGYLRGHAGVYSPASGTIDSNSGRLGFYGIETTGRLRLDLYLGGSLDWFTSRRGINFGQISRTATGKPTGLELNANSNLAYDYKHLDWGTFSPFAGLNFNRAMIGGFTETGADTLNLSVNGQTAQSLQSTLGLRFSQKFDTGRRVFVPYLSAGWRHEFIDQNRTITAQLAGSAGAPFSVVTGNYARDGTVLGSGFSVTLGKRAVGKLDWSSDFRSHYQDTTVSANFRFRF